MAFSKNRRLADLITVNAQQFITSAHITDTAITPTDLHSSLDLTSKTVLVANASTGDNDTTAANTAFVQQELAALVDSAPGTLNTLNELAAALGDDAAFSTTVTNSIATKLPLAGGNLTGNLGIGASSPGFPLHINSSSTDVAKFQTSGAYTYTRFQNSSKTWALSVGNDFGFYDEAASATRMIIDNSGNVGIGADPSTLLHIKETGSTSAVNEFLRIENTAGGGAAAGSSINFHHYHAGGGPAGGAKAASITAQNMDSWGAGTPSGYSSGLTFGTLHQNTFAERMRIHSTGEIGVGVDPTTFDSRARNLVVYDTGDAGISIVSGDSSDARIAFTILADTGLSNGEIRYDNNDDTLSLAVGGTARVKTSSIGTVFGDTSALADGITGSPNDLNQTEIGPGYLRLKRDDTANSQQLSFDKNGSNHSYLETASDKLIYVTNHRHEFSGNLAVIGTKSYSAANASEVASQNMALYIGPTRTGGSSGVSIGDAGGHPVISAFNTSSGAAQELWINKYGGGVAIGQDAAGMGGAGFRMAASTQEVSIPYLMSHGAKDGAYDITGSYLGGSGISFGTNAIFRTPSVASPAGQTASTLFLSVYSSGHWGEYPTFKIKVYGTYYVASYREYLVNMVGNALYFNEVEASDEDTAFNYATAPTVTYSAAINSGSQHSSSVIYRRDFTLVSGGQYLREYAVVECAFGANRYYSSGVASSTVDGYTNGGKYHFRTINNTEMRGQAVA